MSPFSTALTHRCPACGKGKLYAGVLRLVDVCADCGQRYDGADVGDGPAFFVITLVGFLITGLAVAVELLYTPPLWLHAALWIPLTFAVSLFLLRAFKSYLVALQLQVKRLDATDKPD